MVEWILSSTVLIGSVIALRWLFRNKLKMTVRYALWALVLLRLLLPFSIGEAVISVGSWAESLRQQPAVQQIIEIQIPVQSQESAYEEALENYRNQGVHVETLDQNTLNFIWQEAQEQAEKKPLGEILTQTAKILWLAGAVLVAGFFGFSNFRFGRNLWKNRRDTGICQGKLRVFVSENLDSPCLFGLPRPSIYITETALSDPTLLRHTLAHEATHYRHGDHIWAILRGLCLAIHWFNPLVWIAAILSQRDGELACDEATVARLGEGERAEYGRTLIGMTCGKKANVFLAATRMTMGSLRQRIRMLAKKPKMAGYILAFVALLAAVAVGCTFTGPGKEEPQPTQPTQPPEEIWDTKPYITYDGTRYYEKKRAVLTIPEGYESIGTISVEGEAYADMDGYLIFALKDREKLDHFYLYGETGTIVGKTYYHDKKQMAYTLFGTEYYILPEQKQDAREDVFFRKYDPNGLYLGKAEGYAVIYSDGEIPRFRVLRYNWENETVKILEEQTVEAALMEGITVNHLQVKTGHMYFGSVADPEGTWETLELTAKDGRIAKCSISGRKFWFTLLNRPVGDFRVIRTDRTTVFNMTEFLQKNAVQEISFQPPEQSQTPTEPQETNPPVELILAELDDPNLGPLYTNTDPTRISIRVEITAYGERAFYIIPENQEEFLEAFQSAMNHVYDRGGFVASETDSGFYLCYQDDDWPFMSNGAIQRSSSMRIEPEHAEALFKLTAEAVKDAGIQKPVLPEEIKGIRKATLEWYGTETVITDRRILAELEDLLVNSTPSYPSKCGFGWLLTLNLSNGETKTLSMASDQCCAWMSNGVYYQYGVGGLAEELANTVFYSLFACDFVREAALEGGDPLQWFLYIHWSAYDAAYGSQQTRELMEVMKTWFQANKAYSLAFMCQNGLNEEYRPLYAEMLAQLAEEDKAEFASQYFGTWKEMRTRITALLSEHWNLTPEETNAKLQAFKNGT